MYICLFLHKKEYTVSLTGLFLRTCCAPFYILFLHMIKNVLHQVFVLTFLQIHARNLCLDGFPLLFHTATVLRRFDGHVCTFFTVFACIDYLR
jgi:hypothetical protein